jgi:hypothetical protein
MKRLAFLPFLFLLLQACSSVPQRRPADAVASRTDSPTIIYVVRRGWHIDIGFSSAALQVPLASLGAQFNAPQYLFFGFGDRHYLLAKNKDSGMLGALWPGDGIVLVTALGAAPEEAFGNGAVIRLRVGAAAARSAQAFVWESILKENGAPRSYGKGPYEGSLYFAAVPKYSALHTCNTWVAEALAAAGLPVNSRGVVFALQLWSQTRRIEGAEIAHSSGSAAPSAATRY